MPSRQHVSDDLLHELHAAVLSARLSREDLVGELDGHLVANFPEGSSPGGQIWQDLCDLNNISKLADASVPLHTWLRTAFYLAGPREETKVFVKAMASLGLPIPASPFGSPTAGSSTSVLPDASATPSSIASFEGPAMLPSDTGEQDILIVTVLPEEYGAVLRLLSNARAVQGSARAPALYGWRTATIARAAGGSYRVVLALTGRAGNVTASQVVVRSLERWKPRYILLVGIAGGLPHDKCKLGDVVVSTEIYGYEYGKIDGGFRPRANWTYQVDRGLCAGAKAFSVANPLWWSGAAPVPKVLFGPVASGDKVVEDPSDPFFAAVIKQWPKLQAVEMEGVGAASAIDELHATGGSIGFLMVRGISDVPRPAGEREEGGQTEERDANKARACEVAAAFVVRWIAEEWPVQPRALEDPH